MQMKSIAVMASFSILLFIFNVSATQLGISPPKLEFNSIENERVCENFTLYVKNYSGELIGEDKWNANESKNLRDYNLKAEDLKLEVDYIERIVMNEETKKEKICITGEKQGIHYGALFFRGEESYAGVGIWLKANIEKNEKLGERVFLTGFNVVDRANKELLPFSLVVMALLLAVLIFLLVKRSKSSS